MTEPSQSAPHDASIPSPKGWAPMNLARRIENMFTFLYAEPEGNPCQFDRGFLDEVKAAALRGCAVSEIERKPEGECRVRDCVVLLMKVAAELEADGVGHQRLVDELDAFIRTVHPAECSGYVVCFPTQAEIKRFAEEKAVNAGKQLAEAVRSATPPNTTEEK
jgi:hypothetical protein